MLGIELRCEYAIGLYFGSMCVEQYGSDCADFECRRLFKENRFLLCDCQGELKRHKTLLSLFPVGFSCITPDLVLVLCFSFCSSTQSSRFRSESVDV